MSRLDITVRTPDGDVTCKGLPTSVPGLYVTAFPDGSYGLIHTSGVGVGFGFTDPEAALAAAAAAGGLLDWSQPAAVVNRTLEGSPALCDRLVGIVSQHGGSCFGEAPSAAQLATWDQP